MKTITTDLLAPAAEKVAVIVNCTSLAPPPFEKWIAERYPETDLSKDRRYRRAHDLGKVIERGPFLLMTVMYYPSKARQRGCRWNDVRAREKALATCLQHLRWMQLKSLAIPKGMGLGMCGMRPRVQQDLIRMLGYKVRHLVEVELPEEIAKIAP